MEIKFIGSGDAFGSGGRLQPCVLLSDEEDCVALDCGLSALISIRKQHIEPNKIDAVIISHLHGDHCGGLPFLLMDAMLGSKRKTPLSVIGPEGIESHIRRLQDALFPGSEVMIPKFDVDYIELTPFQPLQFKNYKIKPVGARHTVTTRPLALRLEKNGRSIVYTGDGECTGDLVDLSDGADLMIAECYYYNKPVKWHLNYPDIKRLKAKRTVLTHMSENMLGYIDKVPEECAYDGMTLVI